MELKSALVTAHWLWLVKCGRWWCWGESLLDDASFESDHEHSRNDLDSQRPLSVPPSFETIKHLFYV